MSEIKTETAGPIPTNAWVGEQIGYSESGASLLRRGHRSPTLALMRRVQAAVGWSVHDQVAIEAAGQKAWSDRFEQEMCRAYGASITTTTTTNEEQTR